MGSSFVDGDLCQLGVDCEFTIRYSPVDFLYFCYSIVEHVIDLPLRDDSSITRISDELLCIVMTQGVVVEG